jgi:hypothetical protein
MEEACRRRYRGLTLFTSDLRKVLPAQIGQLNVITAIQKGSGISTYAEAQWAGSVAGQADEREAIRATKGRSIRRFHFLHSSQECDPFDITVAHVEEDAGRIIVNRLYLVALAIAPDLNNGVGLRQQELLWWMKRILEVPEYLRWGTDR